MDVLVALVVGGAAGFLLGRAMRRDDGDDPAAAGRRARRRPNRRQRKILATLPPDPPPRSLEEIIAEEVAETGVDTIPGGSELPVPVKLKVFHRDRPALGDHPGSLLRYVIRDGIDAGDATVDDVALTVEEDSRNDGTEHRPDASSE